MKFRNSRINYLAILKILNYYVDRLEVMSRKLDNIIWVMCNRYVFQKYFPNIHYLFCEKFLLDDKLPHLEKDDLNKTMKSADFWLYGIAERLRCLGLRCVDNSSYLLNRYEYEIDSDSDSDSDRDYVLVRDWNSGDEIFE